MYSHSQKKHKCAVYYGKQKSNLATSGTVLSIDDKQHQAVENQIPTPKEDVCIVSESWLNLKYANSTNVNMQKNLTDSGNFLDKDENALKNATVLKNASSESSLKEDLQASMFPKETNLKPSENISELCPLKSSKKLPENHFSRHPPQQQSEFEDASRKNNGNIFERERENM